MNIRLLGTGAADGIPAFFGEDRVSTYARVHGGKDRRLRSAAVIDDLLKIDMGPDTNAQVQLNGLEPKDWSAVIFTHSDDDHLSVDELQYALYPFTDHEFMPFTIYGNGTVFDKIRQRYPEWPLELVETRSFEPFNHLDYEITPVRARHTPNEDCHNLLVTREGKSILYASDTGVMFEETMEFLASRRIDLLIIECTDGLNEPIFEGHLNIEGCIALVEKLRNQGTLSPASIVVTTHHGARGGVLHHELEALLCPHNILPGFDGMVLEL